MKRLSGNIILLLTCCLAIFSVKEIAAQNASTDTSKMVFQHMVENKKFIFHAQSAVPLRMAMRSLTTEYQVKISGDTLLSSLPYFGRSYHANIGTTDSPLSFAATHFTYSFSPDKKKGWRVNIEMKDKDGLQYSFVIFNNGSASLNVSGMSQDPISFNGYVSGLNK